MLCTAFLQIRSPVWSWLLMCLDHVDWSGHTLLTYYMVAAIAQEQK